MTGFSGVMVGTSLLQVRRDADIALALCGFALNQVYVPHDRPPQRKGFGGHPLRHPASRETLGLVLRSSESEAGRLQSGSVVALLRQGCGGHPLRHPASRETLGLSCEARSAKQDGG